MAGCFILYSTHMFCAIACFEQHRRTKRRKCKTMALEFANRLTVWAQKGCPSCQHSAVLMEAEKFVIKNKFSEAIKAYKKSILLAGRLGFINDQALANERLGAYYWSMDLQEEALFHIENATRLYQEWGNRPKCEQMHTLYLSKISPPETIRIHGDSSLGMGSFRQ